MESMLVGFLKILENKMRVVIFSGSAREVERDINHWLASHEFEIINVLQTEYEEILSITIFYRKAE